MIEKFSSWQMRELNKAAADDKPEAPEKKPEQKPEQKPQPQYHDLLLRHGKDGKPVDSNGKPIDPNKPKPKLDWSKVRPLTTPGKSTPPAGKGDTSSAPKSDTATVKEAMLKRASWLSRRWDDVTGAVSDAGNAIGNAATDVYDTVRKGAHRVAEGLGYNVAPYKMSAREQERFVNKELSENPELYGKDAVQVRTQARQAVARDLAAARKRLEDPKYEAMVQARANNAAR